jgi:hypothetical protein
MKAMSNYLVDDRKNMAIMQMADTSNPFLKDGESSHDEGIYGKIAHNVEAKAREDERERIRKKQQSYSINAKTGKIDFDLQITDIQKWTELNNGRIKRSEWEDAEIDYKDRIEKFKLMEGCEACKKKDIGIRDDAQPYEKACRR